MVLKCLVHIWLTCSKSFQAKIIKFLQSPFRKGFQEFLKFCLLQAVFVLISRVCAGGVCAGGVCAGGVCAGGVCAGGGDQVHGGGVHYN
jgi:hypothetical protein